MCVVTSHLCCASIYSINRVLMHSSFRVKRSGCWVLVEVELPESSLSSLCWTSESVFFHLFIVGYRLVHVWPQIHISAQGGEHLYLQVGDGFRRGGQGCRSHGAVEQRVGWVAARRMCRLPVRLQVVSQVLASILQLVLIQDDVKQFLCLNKTYFRLQLLRNQYGCPLL